MDGPEFRQRGREMVDYIVDYMENIGDRRVTPNIEPGYLQELIPKEPPQKPEEWEDVMKDVEDKIMVGVSKVGKFRYIYSGYNFMSCKPTRRLREHMTLA